MNRFIQRVALVVLAASLASCAGARFERDWKAALAASKAGAGKESVAGPWEGTWLSHVNGHQGKLRCLAEPLEAAACSNQDDDTTYRFRYHATWGAIFSGGFDADFPVVKNPKGGYHIKGEKDLGIFGGFDHDGQIQGSTFEATYASDMGDHGVFEMKRPAALKD